MQRTNKQENTSKGNSEKFSAGNSETLSTAKEKANEENVIMGTDLGEEKKEKLDTDNGFFKNDPPAEKMGA